ncbi:MAG: helicase-related protein [Candidatus Hydrogenedentes bacterium]|nr:helicase-related protein [Candidatus Hydrogenedentota bacterium]
MSDGSDESDESDGSDGSDGRKRRNGYMENIVSELKPGTVITGSFCQEPVKVDTCKDLGEHIRITGRMMNSNQYFDRMLSKNQLSQVRIDHPHRNFSSPARDVFLGLETVRYRYASLYDPLLAVNVSKVDPLPHQIDAVYQHILRLPRIRYLIADDPGAGKTIMAGLIIKELKLRSLIKRILIVVPGHLKDQWQREMRERFDEEFEIIDRKRLDEVYRVNIWEKYSHTITSMDFAKLEDVRPILASVHFDLIIVDEAHKLSAYRYGQKTSKSERYKLGEILSANTEHLLFLSATPHKGDVDNFRLFLDLLEPGFFATNEMLQEAIRKREHHLFIRRIKEDLKDFEGRPLFTNRFVKTVTYNLEIDSPRERQLYDDLSIYVERQYNQLKEDEKKRNVAFALVILQRRFASSMYALLRSLERRKNRLEEYLSKPIPKKEENIEIEDIEEIEDLSEEERWEEENRWEAVSSARNEDELRREIKQIDEFIYRVNQIIENEEEIKLKRLKESITELMNKVSQPDRRKVLIFTESKDTLYYLAQKIKQWGYKVNTIHGGMNLAERVQAESIFKNETEIMVATDAAGEGINLQFCNLMINYDIPWTPVRLEQRMGRIHRYGQTYEVFVHNFVAQDTREGIVLGKILDKLEEIRKALGSDKVYDVIGELIDSRKCVEALTYAALNARTMEEILKDVVPNSDPAYIARVKENIQETLVTRYINFTAIRELSQKAKENRLIPEYTESYFKKVFQKLEGTIKPIGDKVYTIPSVPRELLSIAEKESFRQNYGLVQREYKRVSFDKDVLKKDSKVEFLSFGHPLFEAVQQWVENNLKEALLKGAVFYDPDGKYNGYIFFYEGEVRDGTDAIAGKRLFSFYYNGEDIKLIHPSVIWDFIEENEPQPDISFNIDEVEDKIRHTVIQSLEQYMKEILEERTRQAEIKKKSGVESLKYLINCLDGDLINLYDRRDKGEDVELVINNKKEQKQKYEHRLKELTELLQRETSLTMGTPKLVTVIKVLPLQGDKGNLQSCSDEKIEAIGMQVAMEYERKQGRNPIDVSTQNLGFDIRSEKIDKEEKITEIRYIEVKARAHKGDVVLTQNEWFKAQRFGDDYYLYVVFNTSSNPELIIFRNPAQIFKPEEKIELVRYIINYSDIEKFGKTDI